MRCRTCHRRLEDGTTCPRDGWQAPGRASDDASSRVPQADGYESIATLGSGGSAIVIEARDRGGAIVALKVARFASDEVRARFAREADAMRRIGSPAAPRWIASETSDSGTPRIVMERLDGETLARRMARAEGSGAFALDDVRLIVAAIARALDAVHAAGIAHRDVKPENVVLRTDGEATLLDLGLCTGVGETRSELAEPFITRAAARLGTMTYMAPEQVAGGAIDARADVYSLGAVAFELATGRPPFVGGDAQVAMAHASGRTPRVSELRPEAAEIDGVIARALAKDRTQRFASATELAQALAGRAVVAPREIAPSGAPRGRSTRRTIALLALSTTAAGEAVARCVAGFGGDVQRVLGDRVVVAFAGAPTPEHGAHAALAAAEEARRRLALRAPPVVHVAEARVRTSGGRALVLGGAIERPESWADGTESSELGVILTASAAACVARGTTRATCTTLYGRDAIVASVVEHVRAATSEQRALLVTIRGGAGVGKTRLLDALGAHLGSFADVARLAGASVDARAFAAELRDRAARRVLVAILDDAHAADASILDAIEIATMDRAPLVALVAASPALDSRRPSWGDRAVESHAVVLSPIADEAAGAMFTELLRPVEHVPQATLERLVREANGHASTIVAVADALHRAGAVRRAPGEDGYTLASDELPFALRAASTEDGARAAAFAGLAPAVVRLAEVVAVFEVDPARELVERCAGELGADLEVDVGVGLERLARAGVTVERGATISLTSSSLRRALAAHTAPAWSARVHEAAFRALTALGTRDAARARHALAAGAHDVAREAFDALARGAIADQRFSEAEEHATSALALAQEPAQRRELLALRARARVRLQRIDDALVDLDGARASGATDARTLADLALDEATARDWRHDVEGSASAADHAASLAGPLGDARLDARLDVARGRTAWRRGAHDEARVTLERAVLRAASLGDVESSIVAGLMLGSACVYLARLDEAARAYDDAIARCESSGDRFHLAVACSNRLALWTKLRDSARAEADLRRAVRVARELGNAQLERIASHNLGELLYLRGELDAALPLARRSLELQRRFFTSFAIPHDALLVARILAVRDREGDEAEARALLGDIEARWPASARQPWIDVLVATTEALVDRAATGPWPERVAAARERGVLDEHAEVMIASILAASRAGAPALASARAEEARAALAEAPQWLARIAAAVGD